VSQLGRLSVIHPPWLTGGLNRTQVNSKERSDVTVAGSRVEAEDTKVKAGEAMHAHHCIGVGPKRDQRQKFGKVIALCCLGGLWPGQGREDDKR
jgi:hypothetical protein